MNLFPPLWKKLESELSAQRLVFLICILEFFESNLNFFDPIRSRAEGLIYKMHFLGSILPVLVKIIANTVLICNSIWHQ